MVVLDGELEDELRKIGWDFQKRYNKIDPIAAYDFVSQLVKTEEGKEKIKETPFYVVLKNAISKINKTI